MKLSYSPAFGPFSCKVSRVGEMFIKGVRHVFIGGDDDVVELYGSVGVSGRGKFIVERFYCLPVCVLVMYMIPGCVYAIFPKLLFVFSEVAVYFLVEFCYVRVVGVGVS